MSHSKLLVRGGQPLNGTISISGAKNAILPLMAATLLTKRPVEIRNVPEISDVTAMKNLLRSYGVIIRDLTQNSILVEARDPKFWPDDPEIGGTFRASILVLGPLLVRLGRARVYIPGGDNIDSQGRGIDFHINNFKKMGADVRGYETYIDVTIQGRLQGRLQGKPIVLPKVSVGTTQNTIMAACAAHGRTTIGKASIEPETEDLIKLLKDMGADIELDKPNRTIRIQGKQIEHFSPPFGGKIHHTVIPDRIEAGTYAIAAAITGGRIEMEMNVSDQEIINLLDAEFWRLLATGVNVTRTRPGCIVVQRPRHQAIEPVCVKTSPYPGFPTDLHPQWAALMCFSNGSCWIKETIFDGRFKYIEQLQRMGADIQYNAREKRVDIRGGMPGVPQQYYSYDIGENYNVVEATDIRAGAALILAALAKEGLTVIQGISHVERGYANFVEKFHSCGALMELRN